MTSLMSPLSIPLVSKKKERRKKKEEKENFFAATYCLHNFSA
jgi:hypothetical protein